MRRSSDKETASPILDAEYRITSTSDWSLAAFSRALCADCVPYLSAVARIFTISSRVKGFTILIANIGSGMGAQLGAARLLYGMGGSGGIPKNFFGAIEPKNRFPRNNVIFVGAIALLGAFVISYQRGTELLNFGALIAFMGVNAAAFVRYFWRAEEKRWTASVAPVLGFLICFYIWRNLGEYAIVLGALWMAIGIAYGIVKTKGFQADLVKFDIPAEED